MREFNDVDFEISKILFERVKKSKLDTITYNELSKEVKKRTGETVHQNLAMSHKLGKIINVCIRLGVPIITAKVVNKETGYPGPGFRTEALKYRPEYESMTDYEAWSKEMQMIYEWTDWTPFEKFINGVLLEDIEPAKIHAVRSNYKQTEVQEPSVEQTLLYIEGEIDVVTYEVRARNVKAREKCIEHHDAICACCSINLGELYGKEFEKKIHSII